MSAHDAIAALPNGGNASSPLIRNMCEKRFAYCLDTSENPASFVAVDPVSGALPLYLIQSGILFQYDSTDSTTTADGVTCLVTSDGKRYKTNGVAAPFSVLSRTTTAEPVSPAVGDIYLIPTAATGTNWSGKDGTIGIFTARGWQFAISPIGREIYVQDVDAFYHKNAAGTWTGGVGTIAIGANSISLQNVIGTIGAGSSLSLHVDFEAIVTAPDTSAHTYEMVAFSASTGLDITALDRRLLTIEEAA